MNKNIQRVLKSTKDSASFLCRSNTEAEGSRDERMKVSENII
jgi:hypothetical protein